MLTGGDEDTSSLEGQPENIGIHSEDIQKENTDAAQTVEVSTITEQ
jgi:Na+-transporting NADH:ubiquinone oxidoreductase subunit E